MILFPLPAQSTWIYNEVFPKDSVVTSLSTSPARKGAKKLPNNLPESVLRILDPRKYYNHILPGRQVQSSPSPSSPVRKDLFLLCQAEKSGISHEKDISAAQMVYHRDLDKLASRSPVR
ncbi:hypothetical protein HYALB_00005076 [Hymenoscyphus albidus]|uniref:Uncharacterized protein n=1 Tax=Hymenoscyphus albidus TaxID=595503 RepID=A0A9N9LVX6_9HELO|nr:hypothetical protein HYALB_00005076 [Hymenoscyphus albidus]